MPSRSVSFAIIACAATMTVFAGPTANGAESSSGGATPTPSAPTAPMQIALPAVYIASVSHTGTYAKGPITTLVTVKNRSASVVSNVTVTQRRLSGGQLVPMTLVINVPASGQVPISFADPDGLETACFDKTYTIELSGQGSIDTRARKAVLHPTCTFEGKIANPLWTGKDDSYAGYIANKAYVDNIHFPGGQLLTTATLACGQPIKIEGIVANASTKTGNPIFFGLKDPSGKTTIASAGPLLVGAKGTKTFALSGPMQGYGGVHAFALSDPNGSLGAGGVLNGITMDVTRSCSVDVKLE